MEKEVKRVEAVVSIETELHVVTIAEEDALRRALCKVLEEKNYALVNEITFKTDDEDLFDLTNMEFSIDVPKTFSVSDAVEIIDEIIEALSLLKLNIFNFTYKEKM